MEKILVEAELQLQSVDPGAAGMRPTAGHFLGWFGDAAACVEP